MAGQNRSPAVMARRVEPADSLDYFPTPPWATRALCEALDHSFPIGTQSAWEPACGEGHMARPLNEYFRDVYATDVHDYSETFPEQHSVRDFVLRWGEAEPAPRADWIITNPPFRLGERFIEIALERAEVGVAMLVRTSFLEGCGRYKNLFSKRWPTWIWQFTERVPMFKGQLDPAGSAATSYCWIVWTTRQAKARRPLLAGPPQFNWIAPCRKRLERPGDYPAKPVETLPPAGLFGAAS